MAYGHAERNLALIRQLEAETKQLLATEMQPDPEPSAWMLEASPASSPGRSLEPCDSGSPQGIEGSVLPWLGSCTTGLSK